jgi:putative sigma-54 modulation protein
MSEPSRRRVWGQKPGQPKVWIFYEKMRIKEEIKSCLWNYVNKHNMIFFYRRCIMRLSIVGKGMAVSDYLESMVEKKASKLEKFFKDDTEVIITLSIEKMRHIAEVTVPFYDGTFLRTEETSGDLYSSVDAAIKKLERKIKKHKTRLQKDLHEKAYDYIEVEYEEETAPEVVRQKSYSLKPMDIEEAGEQMELLGHNFFVFTRAETGDVNVLYRRKDGDYGLLEPEYQFDS